eukprot:scaffold7328_cov314-Pinguiococcus_pyrenoidosus.AAC.54
MRKARCDIETYRMVPEYLGNMRYFSTVHIGYSDAMRPQVAGGNADAKIRAEVSSSGASQMSEYVEDAANGVPSSVAEEDERLENFLQANTAARERYRAEIEQSQARRAELSSQVASASGGTVTMEQLVDEHQNEEESN